MSPPWFASAPNVAQIGVLVILPRMAETPLRKHCITPDGFRKLQEEHDRLWRRERPRVTREVEQAAAQGDRSENAEYIYGKKRLREIDSRLRFLQKRMDELSVVRPEDVDQTRVFFGAWVELEDDEGLQVTYRLVGPDETDVAAGAISIESPVGRVLVGRREGDEVTVRRPAGAKQFAILRIRYVEFG
jgi:transcription elongation factor GreB